MQASNQALNNPSLVPIMAGKYHCDPKAVRETKVFNQIMRRGFNAIKFHAKVNVPKDKGITLTGFALYDGFAVSDERDGQYFGYYELGSKFLTIPFSMKLYLSLNRIDASGLVVLMRISLICEDVNFRLATNPTDKQSKNIDKFLCALCEQRPELMNETFTKQKEMAFKFKLMHQTATNIALGFGNQLGLEVRKA